jgi:hypothetical protein
MRIRSKAYKFKRNLQCRILSEKNAFNDTKVL